MYIAHNINSFSTMVTVYHFEWKDSEMGELGCEEEVEEGVKGEGGVVDSYCMWKEG